MTMTMPAGIARVTVVAPYTRIDVALPQTATLAELLPALLRLAGEEVADSGAAHGGWALARVGEGPLDTGHTVDALGLRDGDVLHLRPRRAEMPTPVFDDVVDAIATTTRERASRWQPANTRRTGLVIGGLLLSSGAPAAIVAGPNRLAAGVIAAALAVLLVFSGAGLARALQDSAAGTVLAVAGLAYAFAAGLVFAATGTGLGRLGRTDLLPACSALLVAAVVAAVLVGDFAAVFAAAAGTGLLGALTTLFALLTGTSTHGGAAVAAAVAISATPLLPLLALRLARLPLPAVPADASDMTDDAALPGPGTAARAEQAESHLTGLLAACCVVLAGAQLLLVGSGRNDARLLCAIIAAALLLRARFYADRTQRLVLLATGLLGALAVVIAMAAAAGGNGRLLGALGALVLGGAAAIVVALVVPGRPPSPYAARALDIVEIILLVSVIPVAMAVLGAYAYVRGLGG